ncbi:unnamed protein product [Prorocentrum cordatum]|uniref:Uncharacterized protein n=1 Tax=Prorocentrum cordatum TaxID=2364126 RepID=A0ABN9X1F7_9DINO|nr:unnamed protein product [Polarella glacialis]
MVRKPVTKVEEIIVEVPVGLQCELYEQAGRVISRREYSVGAEEESLYMQDKGLGAMTVPWKIEQQEPWVREALLSELHELRQSNALLARQNSWVAQDLREYTRRVELLRADIDRERRDTRSRDGEHRWSGTGSPVAAAAPAGQEAAEQSITTELPSPASPLPC